MSSFSFAKNFRDIKREKEQIMTIQGFSSDSLVFSRHSWGHDLNEWGYSFCLGQRWRCGREPIQNVFFFWGKNVIWPKCPTLSIICRHCQPNWTKRVGGAGWLKLEMSADEIILTSNSLSYSKWTDVTIWCYIRSRPYSLLNMLNIVSRVFGSFVKRLG